MKYLKPFNKSDKKFSIRENKQQAESILDKLGLDKDNNDYNEIRRIVGSNNNYLGLFTKFFFEENASLTELDKAMEFLRSDDSKKLNKNPLKYTFEELIDEITEIISDKKVIIFYNELTVEQKEFTDIDDEDFRSLAEQFYELKTKKGFFKNISKIKKFDELKESMEKYIEMYKKGGNYDSVMDILKENPEYFDIVYDDTEDEIIVVKVKRYEGSDMIGSRNWCIVYSASQWVNYTTSEPRNQYFVWNFGLELSDPNYFTAYTVSMGDGYHAAFDYNNQSIKSKIPKHVKELKDEYLVGPSKEDLSDIELNKLEAQEASKREERERELRRLREKQVKADEHREENKFESWGHAKAVIEHLVDEHDLDLDNFEDGEDIYDVLFLSEYKHYSMEMFEYDGMEFIVGDNEETEESAKESVESLLDEIEVSFDQISYFLDEDKFARDWVDGESYYYEETVRDDPEQWGVEKELTNKGLKFKKEITSWIETTEKSIGIDNEEFELSADDRDEEMEIIEQIRDRFEKIKDGYEEIEDEELREEIEVGIEEYSDQIDYLEDDTDTDMWQLSETSIEEKAREYSDEQYDEARRDPVDFLKNFGFDDKSIKEKIEPYFDREKYVEHVVDVDGYGHSLSHYDGIDNEYSIKDEDGTTKTYHVMRYN